MALHLTAADSHLSGLLIRLGLILAAAAAGARLAARLRQPAVVGEMVAGIVLGPSVLGLLPGSLPEHLLPSSMRSDLALVAQLGLVLFLAGTGHELSNASGLRGNRAVAGVVVGAFGLPMCLGVAAGVLLHAVPGGGHRPPVLPFALYLGVALSVTALPVLARILTDRDLGRTTAGEVGLAAATAMDALGWLVLTLAVLLAGGGGTAGWPRLTAELAAYLAAAWAARHLLGRILPAHPRAWTAAPVVAAVLAFASAGVATLLGLHAAFGAVLAGLVLPAAAGAADSPFEPLARAGRLLLPVFFIVAGSSVDLTGLSGDALPLLALVLPLAVCGKVAGGYLGARLGGLSSDDATAVGILVNTRGLTELIVLSIGLTSGLLDRPLYTALVVTALVTTAMTGPLLDRRRRSARPLGPGRVRPPRSRARA